MILIALGSNVGSREQFLEKACRAIEQLPAAILSRSSVRETQALLPHLAPSEWDQPFLNQVIRIETALLPLELLRALKGIERTLGRQDRGRWGPREIDLDLIAYNDVVMETQELTLPHAQLAQRSFVLEPLAEIAPDWRYPGPGPFYGQRASELVKQLARPQLMGILNVTSDSFSGDGVTDANAARAHYEALVKGGADIIDIGAESTRPGATPLSAGDEWARLEPVLKSLPASPRISIDTRHAETAKKALAWGVDLINDVSGLCGEAMREVLAKHSCDIVAMHALTVPADKKVTLPADADVVQVILGWKSEVRALAGRSGIDPARLIFDPGIGFGKNAGQSQMLIDRAAELVGSGGRWLYGHSRKSFIGGGDRDQRTLEISAQLAKAGVQFLRVHDVAAHRRLFDSKPSPLETLLASLQSPALPGIDLSLERMQQALALLGSPEKKLPAVIHVAGTNGKGSTIAYLRAMLEAADKRVHVYTSPHLVRFNERIVLAGEEITDTQLIPYLQRVAEVGKEVPMTFFEATTAAAFLAFAQCPADYLLLEVGLGGRLDATNVIAKPVATVITPIGIDHTEFLGSDLAGIAAEKAGILKIGVPVFVASQPQVAMKVIRERANALSASVKAEGEDWQVEKTDKGFTLRLRDRAVALPLPGLPGDHQLSNAALAAMVGLSLRLPEDAIAEGIPSARWPGRLQKLPRGPLVEAWPGGDVYLDGAHNAAAAQVIAEWAQRRGKPVYAIVGMMARKDAGAYFRALGGALAQVACIAVPNQRDSATAQELLGAAQAAGIATAFAAASPLAAVRAFPPDAKGDLLVTGSLFLAGELLKDHE